MTMMSGVSRFFAFTVALGIFGFAAQSQAASVLEFQIAAPTGGTITYSRSTGGLVGTNISIDGLLGSGTVANDGTSLVCRGCMLNFTTGNIVTSATGAWEFAGGGSFTITGNLDVNGDNIPDVHGTLLSGTFNSADVTKVETRTFELLVAAGSFSNTANNDLLAFYGIDPLALFAGSFNLNFRANEDDPTKPFVSTRLFSGSVVSTQVVPLPAALWLLLSGLGFATLVGRRRQPLAV